MRKWQINKIGIRATNSHKMLKKLKKMKCGKKYAENKTKNVDVFVIVFAQNYYT